MHDLLRKIPKVDSLLSRDSWKKILDRFPESLAREILDEVLRDLRERILKGELEAVPESEQIIEKTLENLEKLFSPGLKRVINATGVIIHTNLGRSILPNLAIEALINASRYYTNLEYDLDSGKRGERYIHCTEVLRRVCGAEDALIVNNNAAAVYLILNTFAYGREVIISRGELVEIGGSFRIPDVMKKSGAILIEVGTTNKTRIIDYEAAITERTALLMKVHRSNFVIKGFTEEVSSDELIGLSKKYDIPLYFDAGSGLLYGIGLFSQEAEPKIREECKKGIDIISFSGDKLLGGPQSGIIVGKKKYIDQLKRNPMLRALRPDKLTLSSLEATLLIYLDEERAKNEIPTLRMALIGSDFLKRRARRISKILKEKLKDFEVGIKETVSEMGGGSLPDFKIPSYGFFISPRDGSCSQLAKMLRELRIPIICRIEEDSLVFDLRTVAEDEEKELIDGILEVAKKAYGG